MTLSKEDIQLKVLTLLKDQQVLSTYEIHEKTQITHDAIVGACMSLTHNGMITSEQTSRTTFGLTAGGKEIVDAATTPEMLVAKHLNGLEGQKATLDELKASLGAGVFGNGMRYCQANKWTKMDAGALVLVQMPSVDEVFDVLVMVKDGLTDEEMAKALGLPIATMTKKLNELKKRKCLEIVKTTVFLLSKGDNYAAEVKTFSTDITKAMILSGEADKAEFRPMNFNAAGTPIVHGSVHPLMVVRKKFKKVLMQMGFEEMKTDQWLESSFWNFDSLFQPQQHPARDAHDTFFMSEPRLAPEDAFPKEYFDLVAQTHENGGFGSIGWRYPYSREETCKNILRTHTTSCSSRHLHALAEDYKKTGVFTPKKYFSIDRVFRNETLDATHLAEFHQVEGLIADRNMTLADLMGFMTSFYAKIGIKDLRFKPAYNPYTEPSMEIFGYHEVKGCYMEVGNSGIFRPEMLRPMGLPEDVQVIAWGLGLDRMTMIRYNINNIRDLFGYKSVIGN